MCGFGGDWEGKLLLVIGLLEESKASVVIYLPAFIFNLTCSL